MKNRKLNNLDALDAAVMVLFHFVGCWRRTSDPDRYDHKPVEP